MKTLKRKYFKQHLQILHIPYLRQYFNLVFKNWIVSPFITFILIVLIKGNVDISIITQFLPSIDISTPFI